MKLEEIYGNYNTFSAFLKSKYQSALKNLQYYDYEDVEFEAMSRTTSKQILETLEHNNFCLNSKNISFIGYNPLFLISSLENNYDKTISLLSKIKEEKLVSIPSFDDENERLESILIHNDFVLDKNKLSLLKCSPVFLIASLRTNYEKTMKTLSNSKLTTIDIDQAHLEEVIWEIFSKSKTKFKNLPPLMKNLIVKYIYDNSDEKFTKDQIRDLAKSGKIPYSYFPSDAMFSNDKFLEDGCKSYEEYIYLTNKIDGYDSRWYCEEDESKLLKLLGKKYKGCKNVEDVIKKMHQNKLKREDMSLLEVFAFELYAAKELKKHNLSSKVDVFAYDLKMENMGSHDPKLLKLYISGEANSVLKMTLILNHEIEHAIQEENIKNGDIVKEYDVDIFSKDRILRTLLGKEEYYNANYGIISFEYDAEFKAHMKTAKMFGLVDVIYEHQNDLRIMKENAKKTVRYAKGEVSDNDYAFDMERKNPNGFYENLNELFEEKMEMVRIRNKSEYLKILKDHPIIRYEYNCEGCFERKSIKELVDCLDKSDKKGIYYNLLRVRIDQNKEYEEDIEENVEIMRKLVTNKKYKDSTRKALEKLISMSQDYKNDKYRGYFYKTGGNKK